MRYILVKDVTKLFRKELLLYSLLDTSFKKPVRLVFVGYWLLLTFIFSVPLLFLLWPINVYGAFLIFGPPFILANYMSKPIWGGKSFFSWLKYQIKYLLSKKRYYDGKGIRQLKQTYKVDHAYTVSRRKDYEKLAQLIEKERNYLEDGSGN